ncbi:MAG: Crp/Fnr family transcriptional regulator, partial [candidate division Zixibacteria bacterium]|nr:Crp/Fnr family transcriptional regulator [candidate division Zixibacteria bacterium]
PGYTLIRQGELAKGLYYIETGQITVQLEQIDGQTIRLSTMGEEAVVGELGLYLGTPASAAVIVNQPGTIYFLSIGKLTEMENTAPQITAALHKFMAQRLSEHLLSANDRLQALLK